MAHAPSILTALGELGCLRLHVGDVYCLAGQNRSAITNPTNEWKLRLDWDRAVMGDKAQVIAVPPEDRGVEPVAQTDGALGDGVEYRLDVRWRTRDDAEDLGRRRLLLYRFSQSSTSPLRSALTSDSERPY
jgi:hypothetical protein